MIDIRNVTTADIPKLVEIYGHYVLQTATTFEYEVPTLDEFTTRVTQIQHTYPYLVAVKEDVVVGYAYASAYKARKAYDWSVEVSVYLAPDAQKNGIGRMLYEQLEQRLRMQNIHQTLACITSSNTSSIRFHERLGYQIVGEFRQVGYKFDTWWDITWMQKTLLTSKKPDNFIPANAKGERV